MPSRKLLKEYKTATENEKSDQIKLIERLSPINNYLKDNSWDDRRIGFFNDDEGWSDSVSEYSKKSADNYNIKFINALAGLIAIDKLISKGQNELYDKRRTLIAELQSLIGVLINKRKYQFISLLLESKSISEGTLFLIKMSIYSSIDIYDEYGDKVSEICIANNSIKIISDEVEKELNNAIKYDAKNLRNEIIQAEARMLNERIKKGKPFHIYRGFTINKDAGNTERVRKGRLSKGEVEEYYKQESGTGISYSLSKDVAGYFAFRGIVFDEKGKSISGSIKSQLYNLRAAAIKLSSLVDKNKFTKNIADDVRRTRDIRSKRPIICKYLIEPEKIKGYKLTMNEAEVNALPLDLKLIHYEIPHSKIIAECVMNYNNKGAINHSFIQGGGVSGGIICFTYERNKKVYSIYAENDNMRGIVDKYIQMQINGEGAKVIEEELWNSMEKYAIEIPEEIGTDFGMDLWNYMKAPYKIIRSFGKKYKVVVEKRKGKFSSGSGF
mgnify:CR=1 FL=1